MDLPTTVQAAKVAIVAATGLSRDALHVYVGLAVFLLVALVSRRPLKSLVPWLAVVAVALAGESVDGFDDLSTYGHWRWGESLHDVANTIIWPTLLMLFARAGALHPERSPS